MPAQSKACGRTVEGVDQQRISLPVVGFVLSCIATAMTLPAFVWLIAGGPARWIAVPCGNDPTNRACVARADELLSPWMAGLVWVAVPLGLAALAILTWAATHRLGEGEGINLVRYGIVVAIAGTLIVAWMAFNYVNRILTEF